MDSAMFFWSEKGSHPCCGKSNDEDYFFQLASNTRVELGCSTPTSGPNLCPKGTYEVKAVAPPGFAPHKVALAY